MAEWGNAVASFNGTSFKERGQGGTSFPIPSSQAEETEHPIPGGTRVVTQFSGQVTRTLDLTAHVTGAQLSGLEASYGVTASLVYSRGTVSARLKAISGARVLAYDLFEVTLNLRIFV